MKLRLNQVPPIALAAVVLAMTGCGRKPTDAAAAPTPRSALHYDSRPIGQPASGRPQIAHVAIEDLDEDGLADVLVCDAVANTVSWIRQWPRDTFTEIPLGTSIPGPVHTALADLNGDGRRDIVVASMGIVPPNNDRVGSIVVLENQGDGQFKNRVIESHLTRVTDVRAVDLTGDGQLDLISGQFGYFDGEIRWLENQGNWNFESHSLLKAPGTIHTPVADFDGDGRPDFAALVAQDAEEIRLFRNLGDRRFESAVLWKSVNPAWASSGLIDADVNQDGRIDLVYTNGDGFDGLVSVAPWHGIQWLENRPDGFHHHRVGDLPGCYSPAVADLDGDGDRDLVAVSGFNQWLDPRAVSLMAWINDGNETFQPIPLANVPTHLITLAAGDLDGDGVPELVTGGFHLYPPWENMSRVRLWKRR